MEIGEPEAFLAKARDTGGPLRITIPVNVIEFMGLKDEDLLKVWIKKVPKQEE